jgi:hypothetical protein
LNIDYQEAAKTEIEKLRKHLETAEVKKLLKKHKKNKFSMFLKKIKIESMKNFSIEKENLYLEHCEELETKNKTLEKKLFDSVLNNNEMKKQRCDLKYAEVKKKFPFKKTIFKILLNFKKELKIWRPTMIVYLKRLRNHIMNLNSNCILKYLN